MEEITRGYFTGERALFHAKDMKISESVFADGESPLKESSDIDCSDGNIRCGTVRILR